MASAVCRLNLVVGLDLGTLIAISVRLSRTIHEPTLAK
jgi:hypothetical protein